MNVKKPKGRDPLNCIIAGNRRLGKSFLLATHAKRIVEEAWRVNKERKVLIVDIARSFWFKEFTTLTLQSFERLLLLPDSHPEKWKHGVRVLMAESDNEYIESLMRLLHKHFRNSVIMFDEANSWIKVSGNMPDYQKVIFTQNGNMGTDVYLCVHRLADVHKSIRGHFDTICYFRTEDTYLSALELRKAGFPSNQEKLWAVIQRVNSRAYVATDMPKYHEWFLADTMVVRKKRKK